MYGRGAGSSAVWALEDRAGLGEQGGQQGDADQRDEGASVTTERSNGTGSTTSAKQEQTVEGQRNTAEATDRIKPAAAEAPAPTLRPLMRSTLTPDMPDLAGDRPRPDQKRPEGGGPT